MANTKSAKKRAIQDAQKSSKNKIIKSQITNLIKNVTKGKLTKDDLAKSQSQIDKTAKKGIISKQKASRLKSRMAKSVK